MRRHPVLAVLGGLYLLLVGLWAPAAAPVVLAATGAFTVLAQPPVFLAALLIAIAVPAWRRHSHAPARSH